MKKQLLTWLIAGGALLYALCELHTMREQINQLQQDNRELAIHCRFQRSQLRDELTEEGD